MDECQGRPLWLPIKDPPVPDVPIQDPPRPLDRPTQKRARTEKCVPNYEKKSKMRALYRLSRYRLSVMLRARPLEARSDRRFGRLLFVTDIHSTKKDEVKRWPDVGLVFIDTTAKAYLSITGKARISDDSALRVAAWRKNGDVWWPGGPNDPDVCVLIVEPITAELWDRPSSAAVAAYEFAKARATCTEPDLGENRKSDVDMRQRSTQINNR